MSLPEAQLITAITAACLLSMAAVAFFRRGRTSGAAPQISSAPFAPIDWFLVALIIGFFALPSLLSLTQVGSTPKPYTVEGLGILYLLRIVIAQVVFLRLRDLGLFSFSRPQEARAMMIGFWIVVTFMVTMASGMAVNFSGLGDWIVQVTGAPTLQHAVTGLRDSPASVRVLIAAGAVLLAPFVEELCFRGYLYPLLKRCAGGVFAAVSVSVLFGIIHASLVQFLPLTIMSLMLILAYERTRTLWTPILAHMFFNALNVIFTLALPNS